MAIQPTAQGIWFYETEGRTIPGLLRDPVQELRGNKIEGLTFDPDAPLTLAFNYNLPGAALYGVQGVADSNFISVQCPAPGRALDKGAALERLVPEAIHILLVEGSSVSDGTPGKQAYAHFHPKPDTEDIYSALAEIFRQPALLARYMNARAGLFSVTVAAPDGTEYLTPDLKVVFRVTSRPTSLYQTRRAAPGPAPIGPPCIKPIGTHNFTPGATTCKVTLSLITAVPYFEGANASG